MRKETTRKTAISAATIILLAGCGYTIDMLKLSASLTNPSWNEAQVQIFGDSIFDLSGKIQADLQTLSGKSYKEVSVSGAKAAQIRDNFAALPTTEKMAIKTLIIDGGANDALKSGNSSYIVSMPGYLPVSASFECTPDSQMHLSQTCLSSINAGIYTMQGFLDDIAATHVEHVILLGYLTPQGMAASVDLAIDALNSGLKSACESAAVDCHFISTSYQSGQDLQTYLAEVNSDGLHPSDLGSQVRAQKIWDKLQEINAFR